jgi:hypothetical protein
MGAPECDYMTWGRPKNTEDAAKIYEKENRETQNDARSKAKTTKK